MSESAVLGSTLSVPSSLVSRAMKDDYSIRLPYSGKGERFEMFLEDGDRTLFPVTATGNQKFFMDVTDQRTLGREFSYGKTLFSPRVLQDEAVDTVVHKLQSSLFQDSGLLIAGCGKGKTVMASEIGLRMGVSSCILVHKEYLAEQWVKALEMLCPQATVGLVRQDKWETGKEKDFVIASTQSITSPKRTYPEEFYRSFGMLFADEVHRYGADTWQESLIKFPAKYRLGLTATDKRFDGMWGVIQAHFGEAFYRLEADPMTFTVFTVPFGTSIPVEKYDLEWLQPVHVRAKLISLLANHKGRNKAIARNLLKAFKSERKVLVITDRKDQLKALKSYCVELGIPESSIGFFIGGLKKGARDIATSKQFVFTTYQMSEEGLDIEELDTLFIGTPRAHIVQTVGRILREFEGKKVPTVFDPIDKDIPLALGWAYSRMREYRELGAVVEGFFERKAA